MGEEITKTNFEEKFPEIAENMNNSMFISIDTEFTGLLSDKEYKPSLFDTGNERYNKLRKSIENFIVMEVGITTFRFNERSYRFLANRYTFYVFPRSFASVDGKFMCQSSSLEFLCQHDFDFNKFVYGGISYLNRQQEDQIRKELYEDSLFRNLEQNISIEEEKLIQLGCSKVAEWVASAVLGDVLHLDDTEFCKGEKKLTYILHKELRKRFHNIWTKPHSNKIQVEKVSENQRTILEIEENKGKKKSLEEDILESLLGFSRIYKLLIDLKKPIVGHNLLLDLIITYNQFYDYLPDHLDSFKQKIHKLFPVIYDTKFLSFELKNRLRREDIWQSNILCDLYTFFKEGRGRYIVLFSPIIELQDESVTNDSEVSTQNGCDQKEKRLKIKFHEAGWDSFCTGYCFIRIVHIFAHLIMGSMVEGRALSGHEFLSSISTKKNCVNIIRGSMSYLCLDGPDPVSTRPRWIHVKTKSFQAINISEVAELFARYGAVDVKPFSRYRALVAVGNHGSAKEILKTFKTHKKFHVSCYHPIRHSPVFRAFIWSGAFFSGGICAYLVFKNFNKIQNTLSSSRT